MNENRMSEQEVKFNVGFQNVEVKKKRISLIEKNPELAKEWHPAKNGNLKPEHVTAGSDKKVWWLCKKGHEWQAKINSRNWGNNCPYCSSRKICDDNCLATLRPELSKEWHPTMNNTITAEKVALHSHLRVWWLCKEKGHVWDAVIASRVRGRGCPYCNGKKVCSDNSLATLKPDLTKEWHPTKNGNLKPEHVTIGSGRKVWWKCKKGHEWKATISCRNRGRGCKKCNKNISKIELFIYSEIKYIFKDAKHHERFNEFECDVLIPSLSLVIEYDGYFWHKDNEKNDKKKNEFLNDSGFFVLRVREKELNIIDVNDIIYDPKIDKKVLIIQKIFLFILENYRSVLDRLIRKNIENYLGNKKVMNNDYYLNFLKNLYFPPYEKSFSYLKPEVAKEWHPTLNGDLKPENVTSGSSKKAWWLCKNGHEWKATIKDRNRGNGCPYDSGRKATMDNCLANINPILAKEWCHEKNGKETPFNTSFGSHKKVWWKCYRGHEWKAVVKNRNRGNGCLKCHRENQAAKKKSK